MPEQYQQVHDEKDAIYPRFRGASCFSLDLVEPISTLTLTKLTFNGNTLPIVGLALLLVPFKLLSILFSFLFRTAQGFTGIADALVFEIRSIFLGAVNWIGHDGFWIKSVTPLIGFDLGFEIATFIEGIPAQVINFGKSLWRQAHTYFGAEFNRFIQFATNNRADMRLMDADDPVITAMAFSAIHLGLLAKDMLNHPILF